MLSRGKMSTCTLKTIDMVQSITLNYVKRHQIRGILMSHASLKVCVILASIVH